MWYEHKRIKSTSPIKFIVAQFVTTKVPSTKLIFWQLLNAMELALALLKIEILLPPSLCFETKSWQTSQFQCKQRIPPKKSSQKNPSKKFLPKNLPGNSPKMLKKFPNNFSKNSKDFENIQFPTSHLEAENSFGLVYVDKYGLSDE